MNAHDFITVNNTLYDVLWQCEDEGYIKRSRGWYVSQVRRALEELAFDTFFDEQVRDYDLDGTKLALEMPEGAFNIHDIFLFNASCCSPATSVRVYWKRNMTNRGYGSNYTARHQGDGSLAGSVNNHLEDDPYFNKTMLSGSEYYANIQNGIIMFSSNSASYSRVRLVFNGIGSDIGDAPIIPRFFREAVVAFVVEKYYYWYRVKNKDEKASRLLWTDAYGKLQVHWEKAENRIKMMDKWERDSMEEYFSRINS